MCLGWTLDSSVVEPETTQEIDSTRSEKVYKFYATSGTKKDIEVVAKSAEYTYDGEAQSVSGLVTDTFVIEGVTYKVEGLSASASGTNAGDYASEVTGTAKVTLNGEDVTAQFNVTTEDGTLKIKKRQVTIKPKNATKAFDGTALTASDWEYAEGSEEFVKGQGIATISYSGSQTLPGSSKSEIEDFTLNDQTNSDNYKIDKEVGTLTVTDLTGEDKLDIEVVAKSAEYTYNGEAQSVSGLVTDTFVIEGVTYKVEGLSASASGTNAGDYASEVTGTAKVTLNGEDVTAQFNVTTEDGTLKINKRKVTISVADASKVYGTTDPTFVTPTIDGLVDDSDLGKVTVVRTNDDEDVGVYKDVLTVQYASNNNYSVDVIPGDFTITQQSINPEDPDDPSSYKDVTVNNPSDITYDGNSHQWKPTVTSGNTTLTEGTDYTVTYNTNDFTNVTDIITVTIEGTGNYRGTVTRTYQINPRAITLTSAGGTKTYDGTALTNGTVTITEGELVDPSDITYRATGTQTEVGSSLNTIEVNYASDQMSKNYDVTLAEGTLTVISQSIDPTDPTEPTPDPDDPDNPDPDQPVYTGAEVNNPSDEEYDGNAHQWSPTVVDGDGNTLVEGTDYTVTYSTNDFTNVTGTITVTITGTGNYGGEITRTYQITPRQITLTSAGGTKTYDGTALTNGTVTLTGELVDPSDITYRATGTQTEVGSSLNTIEVNYASDQMRNNYEVTLVTGTLTVNAAPVTPTTPTTPGGGEGTGTTPATGGPVAAADDDADAEDEPEEEEVEDEETPLSDGEEDVDEGKTPLAKIDVWALINLIAAIITVLFGLILLLSKRHKNDDEEDEEERQARIERGEEKEQEQKRGWICKVLGVLVAIGSVVLFILTEDMSLPMAMTDEWTIWMVIIAVVELVLLLVGRHWKDVDDDEEEQAQA